MKSHPSTFSDIERYELFDNDYKENQVKNELVDAGIVTEETLTQGRERHKLLEVTEQGRNYLEDELDIEVEHRVRGGIVHRYWQHQIRDVFKMAGWTSKIELFDADVYVLMDDKELAVEVAMGANDREVDHAKQRLDRGLDEVWVVCSNGSIESEDGVGFRPTLRYCRRLLETTERANGGSLCRLQ